MRKNKKLFLTIGSSIALLGVIATPLTIILLEQNNNKTTNNLENLNTIPATPAKPSKLESSDSQISNEIEENKIYQSEFGIKFTSKGEVVGLEYDETYPYISITSKLTDKDDKTKEIDITSIANNAFKGKKIKNLFIASSIIKIGDFAFQDCEIDEQLILEFSQSKLTHIGKGAFQNHKIKDISIPKNVKEIGERAFQTKYKIDNQTIDFNQNDQLTEIKNFVFKGNTFKDIKLPKNLEKINKYSFETKLFDETIIIRKFASKKLEYDKEYSFYGYYNLIFDTYTDTQSKTNVFESVDGYVFDALGKIICFRNDRLLPTMWIPHVLVDNDDSRIEVKVTEIREGVFKNKTIIKKLILPRTLKKIGKEAFFGTDNLEELRFHLEGNQWTELEEIGENAFSFAKLSVVDIAKTKIKHLNTGIFALNPIHTLYLPQNIISIDETGIAPFRTVLSAIANLELMTNVFLPKEMFEKYKNLDELTSKLFSQYKSPLNVHYIEEKL